MGKQVRKFEKMREKKKLCPSCGFKLNIRTYHNYPRGRKSDSRVTNVIFCKNCGYRKILENVIVEKTRGGGF